MRISDHAWQRWKERIGGEWTRDQAAEACQWLTLNRPRRSDHKNEGCSVYSINRFPGRPRSDGGATIIVDPTGGVVVTVTKRRMGSNRAAHRRRKKRAFQYWQKWCRDEGFMLTQTSDAWALFKAKPPTWPKGVLSKAHTAPRQILEAFGMPKEEAEALIRPIRRI